MKPSLLILALLLAASFTFSQERSLKIGIGESDITPDIQKKPVYIAGFGKNRKATGVHDPIMARAIVLQEGDKKIALVSVDLIGLFQQVVDQVRGRLAGYHFILVSSTHNHEGPDTIGLWGPTIFQSGVDPDYLRQVEDGIVSAIQSAERNLQPAARTVLGSLQAPEMVHDSRQPIVKHAELVALRFENSHGKTIGIVVQWNCHPETLDRKNTQLSADFVAGTVRSLQKEHRCPVVYFTGTVGGLMSSLQVEVKDAKGQSLADGTFEKTERYGEMIGQLATKALASGGPIRLTPFTVRRQEIFLPIDNQAYLLAFQLGVFDRQVYRWTGDPTKAELANKPTPGLKLCIRTELSLLELGDLQIAAIPGEIYPELVLGKFQEPADPGADFPQASLEPAIYGQMKGKTRMILGLANDEIGYIIPKRQWDQVPPFCYGRKASQYGEINSLGPETAPLLCEAFRALASGGR